MTEKNELLEAAVAAFLKAHENEYKDPKAPKEYVRPFEGEPDFLAINYTPKGVTFVLRSGHKYTYEAPEEKPFDSAQDKPKSAARAAGRGRAAAGEAAGEAAGAG